MVLKREKKSFLRMTGHNQVIPRKDPAIQK